VTTEGSVIQSYRAVRQGWREAFSAGDSEPEMLLDTTPPNEFDQKRVEVVNLEIAAK